MNALSTERMRATMMVAAIVAALVVPSARAAAATRTYPGAAPCNTTLQACIIGSPAGSTILVKQAGAENISIDKSITLTRAAGASGVVGTPFAQSTLNVEPAAATAKIVLDGLVLHGSIRLDLNDGASPTVAVRRMQVLARQKYQDAIDISTSVASNVSVINTVIETQRNGISFASSHPGGSVSFLAEGNRITGPKVGDVDSHIGIQAYMGGAGQGTAMILSNVLYDLANCQCGSASVINVSAQDIGSREVTVAGNTIDQTENGGGGIVVNPTAAGWLLARVFDNVVTRTDDSPFQFPASGGNTMVLHGANVLYNNQSPPYLGGYPTSRPKSYEVDPQFVDPGGRDYRLQADSYLRNRGYDDRPDVSFVSKQDAAGKARVAEGRVDIGAYEYASRTGCTIVGTNGADNLFGTPTADSICGLGGNDSIMAGPGPDRVVGGGGKDRLIGGAGADRIDGGSGTDRCGDASDLRTGCENGIPAGKTFPGRAPCDWILQTCLDGVTPGSTVRLAITRVDQATTMGKPVTLKPATGVKPVLGGADTLNDLVVLPQAAGSFTIDRLRFQDFSVDIRQQDVMGSTVRVLRSRFEGDGIPRASISTPSSLEIIGNTVDSRSGTGIRVTTSLATGAARVAVARNRIATPTVGTSLYGVELDLGGAAEVNATVESNLVHGVAGAGVADAAAIQVGFGGSVDGVVRVDNNTIDDSSGYGIHVGPAPATVDLAMRIMNNSISNGPYAPIALPADAADQTIVALNNNLYGNVAAPIWNGHTSGGTTGDDPRYVNAAAGNYRLGATSLLRDAGAEYANDYERRLPLLDLVGNGRVFFAKPDIGAYEYGATRACNISGTDGPDAIGGTGAGDVICGLGGGDSLFGYDGNDRLIGGSGGDHLHYGGAVTKGGRDRYEGGAGKDTIYADDGASDDHVVGGIGTDDCVTDPGDRRTSCP